MSHKDWKGPGWYKRWDKDRIYRDKAQYTNEHSFSNQWTYEKLENFVPPEAPGLPDGLYVVQGFCWKFLALKEDGEWESLTSAKRMDNPETTDLASVVCRVPTEPV